MEPPPSSPRCISECKKIATMENVSIRPAGAIIWSVFRTTASYTGDISSDSTTGTTTILEPGRHRTREGSCTAALVQGEQNVGKSLDAAYISRNIDGVQDSLATLQGMLHHPHRKRFFQLSARSIQVKWSLNDGCRNGSKTSSSIIQEDSARIASGQLTSQQRTYSCTEVRT